MITKEQKRILKSYSAYDSDAPAFVEALLTKSVKAVMKDYEVDGMGSEEMKEMQDELKALENGKSKRKSFSSMLDDIEDVTPDKKDKMPVIALNKSDSKKLKEFLQHKKASREEDAEMRLCEAPLLEKLQEKVDYDGWRGAQPDSYTVKSIGGKYKVTLVIGGRFTVPQKPKLIKIIERKFPKVLRVRKEIILKPEIMEDEGLQKALIRKLGNDFKRFFALRKSYEVKDDFKRAMYKIAGNPIKLKKLRSLISQSKMGLKG